MNHTNLDLLEDFLDRNSLPVLSMSLSEEIVSVTTEGKTLKQI